MSLLRLGARKKTWVRAGRAERKKPGAAPRSRTYIYAHIHTATLVS